MIKKLVLGSALAMAAGSFVFGGNAWSYLKTCGTELRQSVKRQVPLEFEVRHAQHLVEDLVHEIRHSMHVIAEQQVEVAAVEKTVAAQQASLNKQKEAILALRGNLDKADTQYVIAGKTYTQQQVEKDLDTRFNRYKLAEETLAREEKILEARRSALQSNEEQLATLINTKKDLEAELAQLDARMRAVKAAESISDVKHLDNNRLSKAKSLIADLNKQLDIKERLLETELPTAGLIPVEKDLQPQVEISSEIDEYFQKDLAKQPL